MKIALLCSFVLPVLLSACRKDLVRWQFVEQLDTHSPEDRLNKIFFIDDSVGFVIGGQRFANSTLLRTRDGGKTWQRQHIPEAPKALYGITKTASGMLYAIGFDGKLLKSTDRGLNWAFHQLWYLPYKDLAFFDEQKGLAIGGISFYTGCKTLVSQDGGHSRWDSLAYELNDIEMIDGRRGYLAGYGTILTTDDSGRNWSMQDIENDNFMAIHAYGAHEAWTCGYNGSIFHTTDAGKHWHRMRDGNNLTQPRYHLLDICFTDSYHGYAVGEDGVFLYTDDGGDHWMEFEKFTSSTLRCIVSRKDGSLMVCGDNGSLYLVKPKPF